MAPQLIMPDELRRIADVGLDALVRGGRERRADVIDDDASNAAVERRRCGTDRESGSHAPCPRT